jgi:hypothetical protein
MTLSFLQVMLVSEGNPRHIKCLKVQIGLQSALDEQKVHPLQALGHDRSLDGRFLRRFLAISAEIAYNTSKSERTLVLIVFSGRLQCLMMPIATISTSVDFLIALAHDNRHDDLKIKACFL